eukprot:CAMPEP_0113272044 /NCGR_PEP_ID=MMETSP0008_2-20120614/23104_1 /TAXON_ID=97485 /ORGANISM="Prymnesium parvum" /LENGTH=128 /DNA_ID=CAMNT_0000121461 /DNA_START=376 /DNA_END=762 /DNA_ORIENTATION=- /assembly_acc=CAM_ASM_000153
MSQRGREQLLLPHWLVAAVGPEDAQPLVELCLIGRAELEFSLGREDGEAVARLGEEAALDDLCEVHRRRGAVHRAERLLARGLVRLRLVVRERSPRAQDEVAPLPPLEQLAARLAGRLALAAARGAHA